MATERGRLGPWVLEEKLGSGAFGSGYAAHHKELPGVRRAVKVLSTQDEVALKRVEREADLLARLRHPGIVQIHEVGRGGRYVYYVMDLLAGGTLRARVDATRGTGLELADALTLVGEVARAVGAAHDAGVLHRDLKPENILFTGEEEDS